jgi:hypothetical protein
MLESDLINSLVAEAEDIRIFTDYEQTQIIVLRLALKFNRCTLTEAIKRLKKLNLPPEIHRDIEISLCERNYAGLSAKSAELPNLERYDRKPLDFSWIRFHNR